jgi:molybdate transport system ATP-binding protein
LALIRPNGSGKSTLLSLINGDNTKVTANLYLFGVKKGSGEIWDIKEHWLLFDSNDWFVSKNDSLRQMVLSGFDSIGLYTQPSISQKK